MRENRETPGIKKMWSYMHGIVDVVELPGEPLPLSYCKNGSIRFFKCDGRFNTRDSHPILITLEQAEKQGLVKKKHITADINKWERVKYLIRGENRVYVTENQYPSEKNFNYLNSFALEFISFVDDNLNECDPPQETVEWEEA